MENNLNKNNLNINIGSKIEIYELKEYKWIKIIETHNSWTTAGKNLWRDYMLASTYGISGVYMYDGTNYYYNNISSKTSSSSSIYIYGYFKFGNPSGTISSVGLYKGSTYLTSASLTYTGNNTIDVCVKYTLDITAPNTKSQTDIINRVINSSSNHWYPDTFKLYWSGGSGTTGVTSQGGTNNGIVNFRTTGMISSIAGTNTVTEIRLYDSSEGESNYYALFSGSWSGDVYFYVKYTTTFS